LRARIRPAVAAGQADRLATRGIDQADDILLHLAGQHPFDDLHRLLVGHPHALHEGALLAQPRECLVDLRAAAVDHDRIHADQLQQHHVFGKVLLQFGVGHRIAAVLDDEGLAVVLADVGQRLRQDLGLLARGNVGHVGLVGGGHGSVADGRGRAFVGSRICPGPRTQRAGSLRRCRTSKKSVGETGMGVPDPPLGAHAGGVNVAPARRRQSESANAIESCRRPSGRLLASTAVAR